MQNKGNQYSFLHDEGGVGTAWWILWMIMFLILGGVAADSSNAWRMRAELQATADAAAHAGVIDLPIGAAAARASAISYAVNNMDTTTHGNVLVPSDVDIGTWDGSTFTVGGVDADAIRVITRRDASNSNRLKTSFLRLIGMRSWNVSAQAVAQRYFPDCLRNSAIISAEIVDFQSNNLFYPGICIHAQDHVEVNNGNTWVEGVKVTMPSLADFVAPPNDWEGDAEIVGDGSNEGLQPSLGEEFFYPKIIDSIDAILASYVDPADPMDLWPGYIGYDAAGDPYETSEVVTDADTGEETTVYTPVPKSDLIININDEDWDITTYQEGYIYNVSCNSASNLFKLNASVTNPLKNVVVIANCNMQVGNEGIVYDAVLGSTAGQDDKIKPENSIINLGQSTILGLDDGCSAGGNVKVISTASIDGPAGTQYYGVQMLATMDIHIAAQAEGVEGINVQAGGNIDWASNNTFGPICDDGVDPIEVPYFRLVF